MQQQPPGGWPPIDLLGPDSPSGWAAPPQQPQQQQWPAASAPPPPQQYQQPPQQQPPQQQPPQQQYPGASFVTGAVSYPATSPADPTAPPPSTYGQPYASLPPSYGGAYGMPPVQPEPVAPPAPIYQQPSPAQAYVYTGYQQPLPPQPLPPVDKPVDPTVDKPNIHTMTTEDLERVLESSTDISLLQQVEAEVLQRRKTQTVSKGTVSASEYVRASQATPSKQQRKFEHLSVDELYNRFSSSSDVESLRELQAEIERREALKATGYSTPKPTRTGPVSHYSQEDLIRTLDISTDMDLLRSCQEELEHRRRSASATTPARTEPSSSHRVPDMSTWTLTQVTQAMSTSSDVEVLKACREEIIKRRTVVAREQAEKKGQPPLPVGWEERIDKKTRRVYFVNHNDQTTSWIDPRLIPGMMGGQQQPQQGYPYYG